MYSTKERRWFRVLVTRIEDDRVTLRHQGVLEFLTVDLAEMQNAERFRLAKGRP